MRVACMTLDDLTAAVFTEVALPEALWAAAVLLARARSASNTARSALHDRGEEGNHNVDLHGAFGELLLQRTLRAIPGSEVAQTYMSRSMFVTSGGAGLGNHPDLQFEDLGLIIGVDAKTFDCRPNKRYFAIADSKHAGLRGKANAYFAAIAPTNGRRAVVARLIPYADVDAWEVSSLRSGGNPSRNLPIAALLKGYCPLETNIATLCKDVYDPLQIDRLTKDNALRTYLSKLIPALADVL